MPAGMIVQSGLKGYGNYCLFGKSNSDLTVRVDHPVYH